MACVLVRNVWAERNHYQIIKKSAVFSAGSLLDRTLTVLYLLSTHLFHRNDEPYIPPTKPYELSHLATDLVLLARYLLKPEGRLVFFLPTVTDEYSEVDIDMMLCEGMEVIANSLQDFGSWGRRVITAYFFAFWLILVFFDVACNYQEDYAKGTPSADL